MKIMIRIALLLALAGVAALALAGDVFDTLWQRPTATGTVIVPEPWLRRWDPVTVFFPSDRGKAGAEDEPDRFVRLSPAQAGAWTWLDARTLQFRPAEPWPALSHFQVSAGGAEARLVTLLDPPVESTPSNGESDLEPVEEVQLVFAYPVPPAALARMLSFELKSLVGDAPPRYLTAADFHIKMLARPDRNARAAYVVRFDRPIPAGTRATLRLGLADDARAEGESVARITFATLPPFRISALGCPGQELPVSPDGTRHAEDQPLRCDGERRAVVHFTSDIPQISTVLARDLVRIEPQVDGLTFETSGSYLLISGDFVADQTYRLSVQPTPLRDRNGRPLEMRGESVAWLAFAPLTRDLRLVTADGIVERFGPQRIPVEGRGHGRADLRIYRVDPLNRSLWPFPEDQLVVNEDQAPPGPGEAPEAWNRPDPLEPPLLRESLRNLGTPAFSQLIDLPLAHKSARFGLDVAPYLSKITGKSAPGHYLVGLRSLDGSQRFWMRLQVTDLALSSVEREDQVHFVVTSLATGRPVPGAEVRLEGAVGDGDARAFDTLFLGQTDADGAVNWSAAGPKGHPELGRISVRKADDVLVLDPRRHPHTFRDDYWSQDWQKWLQWAFQDLQPRQEAPEVRAHLFTERPVYRPEQEVHVKGWLRTAQRGRLEPLTGKGVLVVEGPGGAAWRYPVELSDTGTFYWKFEEADRPTGIYVAHFEDSEGNAHGQVTFTLDAYRLPTFKVGLFGADPVPLDRPFGVNAIADYYAGGRVADRPVRWRVSQYPYTWAPKALPGFVYSVDARFARKGSARFQSSPAMTRLSQTDLDGKAELALDPGIEPSAWPRTYVIEATITGADDQTVTAVKRVRALPAFAIGLKAPRYLEKATGIPIEIVAVDGAGTPVVGQPLKVHIKHRQWHAHLEATDFSSGEARYVTDTVDVDLKTLEVATTAEPLKLEVPIPRSGVYLIEVEGQDRLGRAQVVGVDLYAGGSDPVAWGPPEGGTFKATADKAEHAPGEVAKLVLESPYQEGQAFVVVEGPDHNTYLRGEVKGGQAVISVPIDRSYAPRVPVHVVLMRGRTEAPEPAGGTTIDLGRPDTLATTTWLKVAPVDHMLGVALTHPLTALPREQIPLQIRLTDPQGRPSAGEVTVWLVDQAVLDLGKEQALDAIPDFLQPRSAAVVFHDTRKLAFGRVPWTEMPGGGDGDEETDPLGQATVRRDFRPVPFYEPALRIGPNGEARLMITLPDNLTRFAVRAKAIQGDRVGFAKGELDVRLPVLAQPVLPRFVRPGDELTAGIIGRVVEGPIGAGVARLEVQGAEIMSEKMADLMFGPDKLARADFRLKVGTPAANQPAQIAVTAGVRRGADGASDAAQIILPVRPDRRPETHSGLLDLAAGVAVPLAGVAEAVRPGTLERSLVIAERPAALRIAGALQGLARPNDGSTGERIARARVFLAADLARQLPGRDFGALADEALRTTLDWIGQSVDGDGRVAPFPGTRGQVQLTAAAVLMLAEARAAGRPVPRRLWDRLTETLRQALRSDYVGFVQGAAWLERASATEALAAAGRLDAAYLDELSRGAAVLGPEAMARATLAASRGGLPVQPALAALLGASVQTQLKDGKAIYAGLAGFGDARDPVIRPDETAALALVARALQVADPKSEKLPILEAALLRLSTADGFGNPEADAEALFALRGAADAQATTVVTFAGDEAPLPLTLEAGQPLARVSWTVPTPVTVTAPNALQAAWWTRFTPAAPGAEAPAVAQGLVVTRTWHRVPADGVPTTEPLATPGQVLAVKVGDVIEEHVQIVNPEDRTYVAIELPLAAGLEPLNPRLATAPPEATPRGVATRPADFERILDDEATWYFVKLPKGTYDLYLRTRATTEGRFQQPGAQAALMFAPETFGRSSGAQVDVGR